MKSKSQRQKDKQKHQLIFKYVKSLNPFNNPESQTYLQKLRTGATDKKDSILLNSKVFEVSVLASKHKKKVSFIDEPPMINDGNSLSKKQKNKTTNVPNQKKIGETLYNHAISSPEKVQSDLIQLQRSIFTTFKIKNDQKAQISYISTKQIPYETNNQSAYYSHRPPQIATFNPKPQTTSVIRAKSCSTITNLGIQSASKAKESQTESSNNLSSAKSSFLSRSQSQSNPISLFKTQSQLSNRSSIFSQQSHNLMVEIFRQKLQSKQAKRIS